MDGDYSSGSPASDYREFPVPQLLADYFLCFWTQSIGPYGEHIHRVLPDACVDIVCIDDEAPVIVGPWTDPFTARFGAGTRIVGARLHPGRAASWVGVPAAEFLNRAVPVDLVWGPRKRSPFARMFDEPSLRARRSALAEGLLGSVAFVAPIDVAVVAGVRWLARNPNGRVAQLSRWMGVSARQLQRRFVSSVGYGPKTLQSVLRFQRLLSIASVEGDAQRFAALAYEAGYADQAHMTREVRRFAGCAPSELLGSTPSTLGMSDLFNTRDTPQGYAARCDTSRYDTSSVDNGGACRRLAPRAGGHRASS